jgi:hypothetical protein
MNTDLINELKTLDPTLGRPEPSHRAAFDDLRDGIIAEARPFAGARTGRWIGTAAAAAAVVAATVLLWPGSPTTGPVPAVPAATTPTQTTPVGAWTRTARSPLSPRHSSFTAWVDGTFVVVGGDEASQCVAGPGCSYPVSPTRDGARYDPGSNSWSSIAEAPEDLASTEFLTNTIPHSAVLGHTVYIIGSTSLLAYDVDADRWRQFPLPNTDANTVLLAGDALLAVEPFADGPTGYQVFEPATGTWRFQPVDGLPAGTLFGAGIAGKNLVLTGMRGHDVSKFWIATVDLTSGAVSRIDKPEIPRQRPTPLTLTTRGGGLVGWARDGATGWFLDPATRTWSSVALPTATGPIRTYAFGKLLNQYVTVAGMIALNGYLFDPVAGRWSATPDLPLPDNSPVLVGGSESLLACWGYTQTKSTVKWQPDCYLLRPAEATLATP